jgi:hypothetical protein
METPSFKEAHICQIKEVLVSQNGLLKKQSNKFKRSFKRRIKRGFKREQDGNTNNEIDKQRDRKGA